MVSVVSSNRGRKRKPLPDTPVRAHIESLDQSGRGIARVDGKVVFVEGALPGEEISFKYTKMRRDFAEARVDSIHVPSPARVVPRCKHHDICGGCSLQHLDVESQLQAKQAVLVEQFRRIGSINEVDLWPAMIGPHWGYRLKARLGVKYVSRKGRVLVGFREKRSRYIADLERCEVLDQRVGGLFDDLSSMIMSLTIKQRLPQIEVAIGEDRIALIFRILEDIDSNDREILRRFASERGFDVYVQRHGPESLKALYPEDPPVPVYSLPEFDLQFRFNPNDFTQVNAEINKKMVSRVVELISPGSEDTILDLFCGLGNFTLPLARRAGSVVGVDVSNGLIARAATNASANGLENAEFFAADLAQEINDQRWIKRRYDKILLDPSRAGAAEILEKIAPWRARRIVYVSCNPASLARDAGMLVNRLGYRLIGAGVMDMFPHTTHVESIALFES